MGWLNAIPTPEKKPVSGGDERSRLLRLRDDGAAIPLPEVTTPWVITWLLEAGPLVASPMGSMPLGWQDIETWSRLTCTPLSPWEARQLHDLSRDYLIALREGEKVDCPAPWMSEADVQANRDAVARKVDNMFKTFDIALRKRR